MKPTGVSRFQEVVAGVQSLSAHTEMEKEVGDNRESSLVLPTGSVFPTAVGGLTSRRGATTGSGEELDSFPLRVVDREVLDVEGTDAAAAMPVADATRRGTSRAESDSRAARASSSLAEDTHDAARDS